MVGVEVDHVTNIRWDSLGSISPSIIARAPRAKQLTVDFEAHAGGQLVYVYNAGAAYRAGEVAGNAQSEMNSKAKLPIKASDEHHDGRDRIELNSGNRRSSVPH